jgi:hypothetical protein
MRADNALNSAEKGRLDRQLSHGKIGVQPVPLRRFLLDLPGSELGFFGQIG